MDKEFLNGVYQRAIDSIKGKITELENDTEQRIANKKIEQDNSVIAEKFFEIDKNLEQLIATTQNEYDVKIKKYREEAQKGKEAFRDKIYAEVESSIKFVNAQDISKYNEEITALEKRKEK